MNGEETTCMSAIHTCAVLVLMWTAATGILANSHTDTYTRTRISVNAALAGVVGADIA